MIPIVSNCIAMRHMNHTNSIKQMYRKDDGFEKILSEHGLWKRNSIFPQFSLLSQGTFLYCLP